ncbi:adenylate/guanylate cyclase domain-containing protein [Nocardia camponoti]|uniref:adenylate/guanylate cyclase domain-containing protein n=1 Tax=Nocardia camponoti TaxID=1616106 RepID=UPI0016684A87
MADSDQSVDESSQRKAANRAARISAKLHAANRRADIIGAVRKARAQLPGDPAFGDPLSVSGPGGARAVARAADKISGGSPTAAREIGFGALQLWQHALERVGRGRGTEPVTIMFTDLVSFSSWSLSAGDERTLALLRQVANAIEPPVAEQRGTVVKRMGDGLMAVFSSPDRAVAAAIAARHNLADVEIDGYRPRMRVGLHTGTPREIGGDWLGVDVNIAARMMEAGGKGKLMMSSATADALRENTLADLGVTVKPYKKPPWAAPLSGVPEGTRIFEIVTD